MPFFVLALQLTLAFQRTPTGLPFDFTLHTPGRVSHRVGSGLVALLLLITSSATSPHSKVQCAIRFQVKAASTAMSLPLRPISKPIGEVCKQRP